MGRRKGTGMKENDAANVLGITVQEYLDLLKLFTDVGMSDFRKIQASLIAGDMELASNTAHSLKGAAGSLGLTESFELSSDMERLLRSGLFDEAANVIRLLEQKMNELTVPA